MYPLRPKPISMAALVLTLAAGCARTEAPLTPEAARAKGDALLRQMSQKLAATQTFSYTAEQTVERVRGSEKKTESFSRDTIVQRPNRLTFTDKSGDRSAAAWYDGKHLTGVSNRDKIWVRGPMPATLDDALDYLSAEYAVQIPTADLLYSNPYDALMTPDTTGGWVKAEKVGDRTCDHLSYQQSVVDWEIWLNTDDSKLPCKFQITYKTEPTKPVTRIVFTNWNEKPAISDATFTPAVPDGYRRIKIMRYASVEDKTVTDETGGGR